MQYSLHYAVVDVLNVNCLLRLKTTLLVPAVTSTHFATLVVGFDFGDPLLDTTLYKTRSKVAANHVMQRRTGGPFFRLLASRPPVPADHCRYMREMPVVRDRQLSRVYWSGLGMLVHDVSSDFFCCEVSIGHGTVNICVVRAEHGGSLGCFNVASKAVASIKALSDCAARRAADDLVQNWFKDDVVQSKEALAQELELGQIILNTDHTSDWIFDHERLSPISVAVLADAKMNFAEVEYWA